MAMRHSTQLFPDVTVGMDLSDRSAEAVVVDADGAVILRQKVNLTRKELEAFFRRLPQGRVVFETGTQSPWISWLAKEVGHEVLVANTRKASKSFKKTDALDAEGLALKGRSSPEDLHPIEHRSREVFVDRMDLTIRDALVRCRTLLVNVARNQVKPFGHRLRTCSTHAFKADVLEGVAEDIAERLKPVCEAVSELNAKIGRLDKEIERRCETKYPETKKLRQIKGVGPITAMAYSLAVEDPKRFEDSRKVGAYFGLAPRVQQSGEWDPQLGISKAGNGVVRRLLVGSAHYIMGRFGEDCDLQRFGRALARRGGKSAKKRAAAAVARKLAVLLHRLWISGEPYEPLRNSSKRKKKGAMKEGAMKV